MMIVGEVVMNKKVQKTLVPGVFFLAAALFFWFLTPEQVPTRETSAFTAQTFPRISLVLVIVCSIGLIISGTMQILRDRKNHEKKADDASSGNMQPRDILRVLSVLTLLIFSAVIGRAIGLLLAGIIVSVGMLLIFAVKKKHHYVIVIVTVIVSYFLFKYLFGLNLP